MSEIKHIVVNVRGSDLDRGKLALTARLAQRFDASVEAVFVRSIPFFVADFTGAATPQLMAAYDDTVNRAQAAAKAAFDAAKFPGAAAPRWTVERGLDAEILARRGAFADLIVLGQPAPGTEGASTDFDVPAETVMAAGRPVLIVPYAGNFPDAGKRILIAWSGKRESVRALADARPFIAGSESVTVLLVNARETGAEQEELERELKTAIRRYGGKPTVSFVNTKELEADDMILSTAADLSADLLVMGAYGRSRLRELILGGATHGILRHMTLPVLMAH